VTVAHALGLVAAAFLGCSPASIAVAVAGGGAIVAAVGFMDDHGHVPAWQRLICHFVGAAWVVWWLGVLPPVDFGAGPIDLGAAGTLLLLVGLVWFLNLFNFMDGIDGIAAVQALSMSLTAAILLWLKPGGLEPTLPLILLAVAAAGFLAWNWPPAKIFMGDVGSGYLGLALGATALWTVTEGWLSVWVWLILAAAFLVDATVTLVTRVVAGAAFSEAHRSHAYQRLSRHWGNHRSVTLAVAVVNIVWLGPWALVAALWPAIGSACTVLALAPLVFAVIWIGAGKPGEFHRPT
jgi:Fuc2NAc and GlcNAc transferase